MKSLVVWLLFISLFNISGNSLAGEIGSDVSSEQSNSKPLRVAVASNFYHPLSNLLMSRPDLNKVVALSSGSSGLLFAQITKGAPFDVFLSADADKPSRLEKRGVASHRQTYAVGQLVLWPELALTTANLDAITGKIAIANPRLAPYGVAAQQTLKSLKSLARLKPRLVKANNVNQAFQFVESGNAQYAFASLSQLILAEQTQSKRKKLSFSRFTLVPPSLHDPIEQQLVLINRSKNHKLAKQFINWLMSEPVQEQLMAMGYGTSQ